MTTIEAVLMDCHAMNNIFSYKQRLVSLLGNCNNATILDYGCGNGDFIELLLNTRNKPKEILAVDSSQAMISNVENRFASNIDIGNVKTKLAHSPIELVGKYDKIICQNVLECVDNKLNFINSFKALMAENSIFILSHHDFDSAIYNSAYKALSRDLVHHFSDTQQEWMQYSDGQIGRKIPGLISQSVFKASAKIETWRLVDTKFEPGTYGYLMADMLLEAGKGKFSDAEMCTWRDDLINKSNLGEYYFAIDLVVAICMCTF